MKNTEPLFELSIVVPVYNGAKSVPNLVEALSALEVSGGLEIVLVNDGSPDKSLDVCLDQCRLNKTAVSVINLSRNFGEHNAVMAGLTYARGAYIITMDDDLQNPPEEVLRLWLHTKNNCYDVVYTYYEKKKHSFWRNLGSSIANWVADVLIEKPKRLYLCSFRCMSSFTVKSILSYTGPFPYVDGLIMQVTKNIGQLEVKHMARAVGRSNYTIRRLIRLFMSLFINFSVMPLRISTIIGFIFAGIGLLGFIFVLIEAIMGSTPQGWASLAAATLLLAGVQLIMLGIAGEYIGHLFLTINKKPQFIIRDIEYNQLANGNKR